MGRKYAPLSISLVDEGRFVEHMNEELLDLQKMLLAHVAKHGIAQTAGSKAELTVKITLKHEGTSEGDYSIKTAFSSKRPGRPVEITKAIHEVEQTGEEALFVRRSGSDGTSPRQQKLATDDGRAIDSDTGEARPRKDLDL